MEDSESAVPASKKRVAGRQISKENPELDADGPEPEMGTFQRASDEVLAQRRIVKVRRAQHSTTASNPFASLCMVPPSGSGANSTNPSGQLGTLSNNTVSEVKDGADEKDGKSEEGKSAETGSLVDDVNGVEEKTKGVEEESKDNYNAEVASVKAATEHVETEKDVENGEKGSYLEAGEETVTEDVKETEKKHAGEESEGNIAHGGETEKKHAGEESESKIADGGETEKENSEDEKKDADPAKAVTSLSSFQQLSSSPNAFTGLAGTLPVPSSFSFGAIGKEGPNFGSSSGFTFGSSSDNSSFPTFGGGNSNNGNLLWQASNASSSDLTKSGKPSMKEVSVETGEENEKAVFTADAILYEYLDGGWKERGKGELKLNTSLSAANKARLIMRARGNYRLILNASLYPDMALASMDKKGVSFACINSKGEGKDELATFALKFKDISFVEEFRAAVTAQKGKKATELKTPENSPKPSDD